jgi:sugar-specific transcriptional regulator TrmB
MNLMQEDIVKELEIFGFTLNQAKVYLTIVRAGSISVGKIAESSKIYRQDIYKIIPKLEKKGVITKTLGSPLVVKAIPVKNALKNLVTNERKNAFEKIKRMEANLLEISNAINRIYETGTGSESEETHYSLLTQDNEIKNRGDFLFEKAKQECNVNASLKLLTTRVSSFHTRFRAATKNGAKIRLLIEAPKKEERIESIVERVRPDTAKFTAKFVINKSPKPFQIIDKKEVWISTNMETETGTPAVLWSNGKNIIEAYSERFDRLWNNKNAITIHPSKTAKERITKTVAAT